ncbi:MAG: hypothetical protein NXI30_02880 [bacterium]|nr:hypothetical protein [bacterium]
MIATALPRRLAAGGILPLLASGLVCLVFAAPAFGQAEADEAPNDTVRVAASDRYKAGRVYRWALGGGYRDLWEAPILLPLLDLENEGGGLEPVGRFGGLQTAVLGLKGEDGGSYTFRGTDKDPSAVLDDLLRDTLVQVIVQDQMAAQHPGGPVVAGALTRAANVLTIDERMVVVPDDPRLGEYREEFAGMVGTYFVYPQAADGTRPGFEGAVEILDHEALYERLRADSRFAVDERAFLRARLMDLLLGDFDRHRKQWRWAKVPGEEAVQPIPEDRDQAFVRYDGIAQRIMKVYIPILQNYGPDYPGVKGLTLHGWEQDRWLLPALSWSDWTEVAAEIQASLTDAVIDAAVDRLPPEYEALDGERLRTDIKGRRDHLPEIARSFYEHLAREVDVRLSFAAERVEVVHGSDDRMRVTVRALAGDPAAPIFDRTFDPDETKEVRLYLGGGADHVVVEGGPGWIRLRAIVEADSKTIDVRGSTHTRIYDPENRAAIKLGANTRVDRRPYVPPPPDSGFVDVEDVPPRDWGSDTIPLPEFGFQPDVGVFLGGAVAHTRYGFRKDPWSSKHSLGFGWAFEASAPRVRYRGQFRPENRDVVAQLDLQYSGIEVVRFYGFGNETRDRGNDRFFRVRNERYDVALQAVQPFFDDRLKIRGGADFRISRTRNGTRRIDQDLPYGNNDFLAPGVVAGLQWDTRKSVETTKTNLQLPFLDNPAAGYPTSGFLIDLAARFAPPLADVRQSYGSIRGSIAGFFSLGETDRVTLALRAGGTETFGQTPYFDLATIGGGRFFSGDATNRGLRSQRLTGDSAVFGNADLRIVLGRAKLIVPGDYGIHGFFDVGRVFFHDEGSDEWHPTGGGGVFFSPLLRTNTLSLSASGGPEETLIYFRIGFHY